MGTPYGAGFDKANIRNLPGCAFWTDATGLLFLGYTQEGATLRIEGNVQEDTADEAGAMPLNVKYGGERAVLSLIMLETTKDKLVRIDPKLNLDGTTLRTGNVPGANITKRGKVVHRPFAYPAGEEDFVLNDAVLVSDLEMIHRHDENQTLSCEFVGLVDESEENGSILSSGIGS